MIDYALGLADDYLLKSQQEAQLREQQQQQALQNEPVQQPQSVTGSVLNYLGMTPSDNQTQQGNSPQLVGGGMSLSDVLSGLAARNNSTDTQVPYTQEYSLINYSGSGSDPRNSTASTGKYKAIDGFKDTQNMIVQFANKYGIDPSIALAMGHIESGFNPNAKAKTSTAKGVFQFLDSTASRYGIKGRQYDPVANIDAGMRLFRDNVASFRKRFGRNPNAGEIYLMHQQGEAGAAALLANPNANVIDVLSRFKSKSYNPVAVVVQNGGNVKMTAGQFASLWINKGNTLQEVYRRRLGRT